MSEERPSIRPLLVIVNGAPGSGKTTLAHALAVTLSLPLISRDIIRTGLIKTFGAPDASSARAFTLRVVRVTYGAIEHLLRAGVSVIADQACARGLAEADIQPLTRIARVAIIHCHAPQAETQRRFAERSRRSDRHPVLRTGDDAVVRKMADGTFDWSAFEPLDLAVPMLMVDTTDGYAPGLDTIVTFVRGMPGTERFT